MKTRLLFLLMIILVTLSFCLCLPAYALERMELDKLSYTPGEPMDIQYYGVTQTEADNQCWIAIAAVGSASDHYLEWGYISMGSSDIILHAPTSLGEYEVRFYRGYLSSPENLVKQKSVSFTVSYQQTVDSVLPDKDDYAPGQYMAVVCQGVTQSAIEHKAWVTTARSEDPAFIHGDWKYVTEGDCTLWLKVPDEPGTYELRYFQSEPASEENLSDGLRIPFTVSGQSPSNDTPVYPTLHDFNWSLLEYVPGEGTWTGTYETNFKTLYVRQDGNKISGEYPEWDEGRIDGIVDKGILYAYWYESPSNAAPNDAGQLICVLRPDGQGFDGWWRYGNSGAWNIWTGGTLNRKIASDSMQETIASADARHLIPPCLQDKDLTENITAVEFAALGVYVFEEYWQTQELPEATPFKDVPGHPLQTEIEKAWGLGFLKRVHADALGDSVISRQLMAQMLCDLVKLFDFDNWTFETDAQFPLTYTMPELYADDNSIYASARDSVYFCTANGIMEALEGNSFMPSIPATREQAIAAVEHIYRMEEAYDNAFDEDSEVIPATSGPFMLDSEP